MRRLAVLAATVAITAVAASAAQACPNYSASGTFGTIYLNAGFAPDPYVRNITAGGGYYLPNCGFNWQGWVASRPDFEFSYQAGGYPLSIYVESNYDTIILINGPDGQWYYNDDSARSLSAGITFRNPQSGVYDIWIGSYAQGSGLPGRLIITELL